MLKFKENLLMEIKDKVVLVTGSTRGIGLEIAKQFSQLDAQVILHGRNTPSSEVMQIFNNFKYQPIFFSGDITNEASVTELLTAINAKVGKIDILINNAGMTADSLVMGMKPAKFAELIATNLNGTFNITQPIFKQMLKRRQGVIINLSSVVGITGNIGQANYAASKAGIIGLTKSLAKEGAMRGVRVNAIAPGMIDTAMTAVLSEKVRADILERIPLKRLGRPAEVAQTAVFLVQNDYITNQTIIVDGGMIE